MSKPIKVVVVVIVVFVEKKNEGKSFFGPKKSMSKNFRPKSVGSKKKSGVKKF